MAMKSGDGLGDEIGRPRLGGGWATANATGALARESFFQIGIDR
jgi:hypothetical protein